MQSLFTYTHSQFLYRYYTGQPYNLINVSLTQVLWYASIELDGVEFPSPRLVKHDGLETFLG
jgi:hypothetical protein